MIPEFLFDFGSPNAYLAHRVIPDIEARTGVRFAYVPVLLGGVFKATGNQAPMQAFSGVPAKLNYERLELRRFIDKHALSAFRFNPHFPVNTLAVMRGAVAAAEIGALPAYVEAVFRAMWEAGEKMDDPPVIARVLTDAGLPAERLLEASQDPAVKDRLADSTRQAVERGVFGSPSFFVGEDLYFGKNTLPEVEAAIANGMAA